MSSDIKQQYLEQLLKFKARKELSEGFLKKKELKKLLKELTIQLGFDENIWKRRKEMATSNFVIYEMLNDESDLGRNMPEAMKKQKENHLLKAINLDPFNEDYLKRYVVDNRNVFEIDKEFKRRLLRLYDPATTEHTNMQVELGLGIHDASFEYFNEHMTSSYVDALVFLREEMKMEVTTSTQGELDDLSKAAGFDKKELKELNEELEKMLEVVEKSADNTFLDWQDVHKAFLVVDRLVDLAPFNPNVLYAAIYFYGNTLWKACFNKLGIRHGNEGRGVFFKVYLGSAKPKRAQMIPAAQAAFDKANELAQRFGTLPKEVFHQSEDDKWKSKFVSIRSIRSKHRMNDQELSPAYIDSFMRGQKIAFDLQMAELKFKISNDKFAIIFGIALYIVSALVCVFAFGSIHFLWTFFIVPGMLTFGVAALREKWWKKKNHKI